MSRPAVSVVMPFAGNAAAARAAAAVLTGLRRSSADQLILADNCGVEPPEGGIEVVAAVGERSPAHARNAGAARVGNDWILFIDADCRAPASLLDDFLAPGVGEEVGALAGGIVPAPGAVTLAERYAAARNPLSPRGHLAHPFLPRASAANLIVRTEAFHALGGFREGLRAAEDTDFCWRLQQQGWRLEVRRRAEVQHVYRTSVSALRLQWRQYAAGRAWLARHYPGYRPEPALRRALRGRGRRSSAAAALHDPMVPQPTRRERALFLGLDLVLALEELRGLRESNEPQRAVR